MVRGTRFTNLESQLSQLQQDVSSLSTSLQSTLHAQHQTFSTMQQQMEDLNRQMATLGQLVKAKGEMSQQNLLPQLQAKFKAAENGFTAWLAKQSWPIEAAVVTTADAAFAGAFGSLAGNLHNNISSFIYTHFQPSLNPQSIASLQAQMTSPLLLARDFALAWGVRSAVSCVMKKLRGKEDVQSRMAAGFCSGAVFGLVTPVEGLNLAATSAAYGLFFALMQRHFFLLEQELFPPPVEDVNCSGTRSMLNRDGLQNFERGLSTDSTLPLLTEREAATTGKPGLCAPSRRSGDI